MIDIDFKYERLIEHIRNEAPFNPDISMILGSGLGDFVENISITKSISTEDVIDYPESTVEGHRGYLHFAELNRKNIL